VLKQHQGIRDCVFSAEPPQLALQFECPAVVDAAQA